MDWRIARLGEDALLLQLGDGIDAALNARVHALAQQLARRRPPWLRDIVPAYASVAVFVDARAFADADDPLSEAEDALRPLLVDAKSPAAAGTARVVEIRVRYGGEDGPDLARVASHAGLAPDEVIALHASAQYIVAMLGFAPGFPYLLGLDARLHAPRLATPRTRVPAGSVGIGGAQAGIYPRAGAGGWNLIGRTDAVLFDPSRAPPALLAPGDRVRFVVERAP